MIDSNGNVNMRTDATSTPDLGYATAGELARRIRDREISSAEVTEAFLARIAANNHKINAIVHLLGVPVTIKEQFLMADRPSTLNTKRIKDFIAPEDGAIVKRIRSAGAVILGKSNVPANLQGYQVQGDIYPVGKNPYGLQYSPGGSSGGGAAAVAGGLTALELGADGGGSLRVPAHFCGVFCLKPTDKTIIRYGGLPLPKGAR